MRRALAILKYLPAVLCGLVVATWMVSAYAYVWASIPYSQGKVLVVGTLPGILAIQVERADDTMPLVGAQLLDKSEFVERRKAVVRWFGYLRFIRGNRVGIYLPIPLILSLLMPAAYGGLTRFRFPLWSYFAWTALVAAELAYYLR